MSSTSVTPRPRWLKELVAGSVAGGPTLLFDWERIGVDHTALRFVVINTGAGILTVTPQCAYKPDGPAEVGSAAPAAFEVGPGECYGDPYGIDEMRPYWRLSISGTSSFEWGVINIPR